MKAVKPKSPRKNQTSYDSFRHSPPRIPKPEAIRIDIKSNGEYKVVQIKPKR